MAATEGAARQAAAAASAPISARCIQKGWPPLYPGYAAARVRLCRSRGGVEDRECVGVLALTGRSCRLVAAVAGSVEANAPLEASASSAAGTPVEIWLFGSLCPRQFADRRGRSRCRALSRVAQKFSGGSGLCPSPIRRGHERCGRQLGGSGFGTLGYDWLQKPMEHDGKHEIHTEAARKDEYPAPIAPS